MTSERAPGPAPPSRTYPAAGSSPLGRAAAALRNVLLLERARKIVRGRRPEQHAAVRAWWKAAEARLRVARQLNPETEYAPAVALYREGVTALVGAALVAVEGAAEPAAVADPRAAWASLQRIWPEVGAGVDLQEFRAAGRVLTDPPPLERVQPDPVEAAVDCSSLARLVSGLERAIEPRTGRRLVVLAATRASLLILAATAIVVVPLRRALAPTDLALGRPVTQSTVLASRANVGGAYLVNGKLEYSYGAHTDNSSGGQTDPWMTIDLGAPKRIGKIAVHNRGDSNFLDCLPLFLEAGLDTSSMKTLGVRKELFTRSEPWVVDHLDETARYVRVRKTGAAYIALDEIEVYAP